MITFREIGWQTNIAADMLPTHSRRESRASGRVLTKAIVPMQTKNGTNIHDQKLMLSISISSIAMRVQSICVPLVVSFGV